MIAPIFFVSTLKNFKYQVKFVKEKVVKHHNSGAFVEFRNLPVQCTVTYAVLLSFLDVSVLLDVQRELCVRLEVRQELAVLPVRLDVQSVHEQDAWQCVHVHSESWKTKILRCKYLSAEKLLKKHCCRMAEKVENFLIENPKKN